MAAQTVQAGGKSISIPTGLFINNEFVKAKGGKTFDIENPATGKVIISVQEGEAEDVDIAVKVARKTFNDPAWRDMVPSQRGALLNKLADLMEEHADELCAIEMLDTGKTHKQASNLDVPGSIGTLRYYAGWADKVNGLSSFNIPKTFAYTRREPVGVCGQIIPWK
jgi:aldehyde dehydrogenase (NAD+)